MTVTAGTSASESSKSSNPTSAGRAAGEAAKNRRTRTVVRLFPVTSAVGGRRCAANRASAPRTESSVGVPVETSASSAGSPRRKSASRYPRSRSAAV